MRSSARIPCSGEIDPRPFCLTRLPTASLAAAPMPDHAPQSMLMAGSPLAARCHASASSAAFAAA